MREDKKAFNNRKQGKKPPSVRGFAKPLTDQKISPRSSIFYNTEFGEDIFYSECDPNGSYTGITRDGDNRPVQDADDL